MPEPPTSTLIRTPAPGPAEAGPNGGPPQAAGPRLKKLRVALVLLGLGAIALVSLVFGMLMAVSSDLPALENQAEFRAARNSELFGEKPGGCRRDVDRCPPIAKLTGNDNRILLTDDQISHNIKNAVISIEDRRFYEHHGVDYKGIARAFVQDLLRQRAAQGGSTITQQFVKNALSAQGKRSVFQKLREAALAYHLERQWSKQKILTEYLNTVYFGNGAYGVESAVRAYFGQSPAQPTALPSGPTASDVTPAQAALLAGMIASPTLYDPVQHPRLAKQRRNLVLKRMLDQRMISLADYRQAVITALPGRDEVRPPRPDSKQPYFSSWLTQQLVDRYRPGVVFGGGLKIRTSIDPDLQASAEQAISGRLAGIGPSASLVAIENKTGEVKAMVGGDDFERRPFNLATNGHRQPGSAFKPFILVRALEDGVSPDATFTSRQKIFDVPGSKQEKFVVRNYENDYSGVASLRTATARSDNSVYAELGLKVGTRRIARLAQKMGIRTQVSTNPAMTLGGLKEGVTPLEMAYAYSTIANKGIQVTGSMAPEGRGPVAIERVRGSGVDDRNERRTKRVFPAQVGDVAQQLLAGVVSSGTGKAAAIGEWAAGKTGTTENYGDAWFVGFNKDMTVAVWVGYPDKLKPMKTEFRGGPVAGGTFPAEIWHDFMASWIRIRDTRATESGKPAPTTVPGPLPSGPVPAPGPAQQQTTPGPGQGESAQPAPQQKSPQQPQRAPTPPKQTPAQPPQPPAGGGGGSGGGAQPPAGR